MIPPYRFSRFILIDGLFAIKDSPSLCNQRKYHRTSPFAIRCKSAMNGEITPSVPQHASRFTAAYQVLNDAIAARAFPGCAFGVLSGNQIVLQDALGYFTYEESSPAVNAETVFDIASITKVAATTAEAMLLHQRGLLDLDTPLGDLLPAFVADRPPTDRARLVNLRHLLAHNSGLPAYVEFFRTASNATELMNACFHLPLEAEPGTRAEYSDPGFILLGMAMEVLIGETLPAWANREVFQPLGMASTCFTPASAIRSQIPPTESDTTFRHRRIQGEVQDENAWLLGGAVGNAGLFSNVPDLLRFAMEILNSASKRVPAGSQSSLFDPATIQLFSRRQKPDGSSRALGWDTPSPVSSSGRHFSPRSIGHLAYSGCSLWIDLDVGVAVVLLTNRTWPDRKCQLIRPIRPAFHDAVREAL
jgi:CubicO group peptidase (beta-lactamase class C family)